MADIICSCDHHHHHHHHPRSRTRIMDDDNIRNKFMKCVLDYHHDVVESSSSSSSSSSASVLLVPPTSKRQKLADMIITAPTPTPTPLLLLKQRPCLDEKSDRCPKFSSTGVCGRRREMEDAVAIHPSFWIRSKQEEEDHQDGQRFHFFGVYDGHGCSHVAMNCKDRLHQLVKEELDREQKSTTTVVLLEWKEVMERSFDRMDKEVLLLLQTNNNGIQQSSSSCKCELQMPQCDAVGSTAVVSIVTSDKVIVANCGDSRAILCRDGKAVPLSVDHKPDLPEELNRIEDAGGRVIYWDGPRVLGVLAMSRAIGDNYLKPYVSSVPEIRVTERSEEDEFLIMASDGLWDVVSNDTACGIVRMCLNSGKSPIFKQQPAEEQTTSSSTTRPAKDSEGKMFGEEKMDKRCADAAMLLTKLALARRSGDNVSVVIVDLRREKKKMMMN